MRRRLAPFVLALGMSAGVASADKPRWNPPAGTEALAPATELRLTMRKLWEDHIMYTRGYIISALAGLPDQNATLERLLRNQDDIGNALKPYYGDEAGQKLTALLREHIMIASDAVRAAKSGNKKLLAAQQERWSASATELAAFLANANPYWSKQELEQMLQKHIDLTTDEVVARQSKDWQKDIAAYDESHMHMLMLADMITDGIIEQFPAKFPPGPPVQARKPSPPATR